MGVHIITVMTDLTAKMKKATMGWYVDEEEAFKAVQENRGGIEECLYDYAVIEDVPPGVYAIPKKEAWFMWDSEEREWRQIPKPEEMRGLISFYS